MKSGDATADVIVVGGGPAGALAALLLGRRGLHVALFDQQQFPREKPCGEGLLPLGVEVLEQAGLAGAVGGQPLGGVRYHIAGASVRSGFGGRPDGVARHGLGQRRLVLDHAIWSAALAQPTVEGHAGVAVRSPLLQGDGVSGVLTDTGAVRARLVVAADGANSAVRRQLGLERVLTPARVGVRGHFQRPPGCAPLGDIQIFVRRGYEIYVTPLPDEQLLVAVLAHREAVPKNLREFFQDCLRAEPVLAEWLQGSTQTSELLGRAPLLKTRAARSPDGLVMIGDAAESVDPVTAGGMSLALDSARLLTRHIEGLLARDRRALACFERARMRPVRTHRLLGAGLRALSQRPWAAAGARRLVEAHPPTMDALVGLASGKPAA